MKILIVEDQVTNRKLLRVQLEAENLTVVEAGDGAEALEILKGTEIDVVISDILMPNMDGFRLCHEIRRSKPLSHLPFILYTSTYNSPADRDLAETVGADRFITKPAPAAVLVEAINQAMSRSDRQNAEFFLRHDENYVLERYNAVLVRKLEEKNLELESALEEISRSRDAILDLNAQLEARVQRRTRELAEANAGLEAFSFSVSHDLRAPLRRIDGFAHVLEAQIAGLVDEEGRFALEAIFKSVRSMGRLIKDLLEFARAGRTELKRQVVDPQAMFDEVSRAMREEHAGRDIVWRREPLPAVWGDPPLLRQVFVNLLDNAVKYTRHKAPAHIHLSHEATQEGVVVLCLKDNGVGFEPMYADKLFGVFQRLHREDEFEGTGIGLAVVQRIIQRHDGRIWAESTPGEGASFFFTLHAA
ncbi:MAG: response regulator [Deltaproteobacteria bacterium]|nr:response regulator [Deltaproteobacteria bacterium]